MEALAACSHREAPIELAILDIRLPGMDGVELAQQIARLRPETKLLFVTGLESAPVLSSFGVQGSDRVLAKPFSPVALLRTVEELLVNPTP
jgi:CheY-like chemotaxis protein